MIFCAVEGKESNIYRPEDFHSVMCVCACECDNNRVLIETPLTQTKWVAV